MTRLNRLGLVLIPLVLLASVAAASKFGGEYISGVSGSGGGGTSGAYSYVRAKGEDDRGVEVGLEEATPEWTLQAEQRVVAANATAILEGSTAGQGVVASLGRDLPGARGNTVKVEVVRGAAAVPEIPATSTVQASALTGQSTLSQRIRVNMTNSDDVSNPNAWRLRFIRGSTTIPVLVTVSTSDRRVIIHITEAATLADLDVDIATHNGTIGRPANEPRLSVDQLSGATDASLIAGDVLQWSSGTTASEFSFAGYAPAAAAIPAVPREEASLAWSLADLKFTITIIATDTVADVLAIPTGLLSPSLIVLAAEDPANTGGTLVVPQSEANFTGGADDEDIRLEEDVDTKVATIYYDENDTISEVAEAIEGLAYAHTDTDLLEPPTFSGRPFTRGGLSFDHSYAYILADGETDQGVEIGLGVTPEWTLSGDAPAAAVQAKATAEGDTQGSGIVATLLASQAAGAAGNDWRLGVRFLQRGRAQVDAFATSYPFASSRVLTMTITNSEDVPDVNDWSVRFHVPAASVGTNVNFVSDAANKHLEVQYGQSANISHLKTALAAFILTADAEGVSYSVSARNTLNNTAVADTEGLVQIAGFTSNDPQTGFTIADATFEFGGYVSAIAGDVRGVEIDEDAQTVILTADDQDSVATILAAAPNSIIAAESGQTNHSLAEPFFTSGQGTITWMDFTGGADAETIGIRRDQDTKVATIYYTAADDSLEDIVNAIEGAEFLTGTTGTDSPEAPTFTDRPFTRGGIGSGSGSGGGGGGALTLDLASDSTFTRARTQLADSVAITAQDSATTVTLTRAIAAGTICSIETEGNPGGYGVFMADDLLAKDAVSSRPSNGTSTGAVQNAVTVIVKRAGDVQWGHEAIYIWRNADNTTIYVKSGRDTALTFNLWEHASSVATTTTGTGTGSGGTSAQSGGGSILTPLANPLSKQWDAGNQDDIVNISGKLYSIENTHFDGHTKAVGTVGLNDTAFEGFVYDPIYVANPAAGDFVYHLVYNIFAVRRINGVDGFTGVTGWHNYDPFASGEPWENAPAGNTYTGALSFVGAEDDETAIFDRATAAGQAFINLYDQRVEFVNTFTASANTHDEQRQVPLIGDPTVLKRAKTQRTYTAEQVGDVINSPAGVVEVVKELTTGHGQTATLVDLADDDFLGVHLSRFSTVVSGKFWFDQSRGGFVGRHVDPDMISRIHDYDPFASGNEWDSAPTGNTYSGDFHGYAVAQNEAAAIAAAQFAGQVFVLTDDLKVVFVDTFSAATAGYTQYLGKPLAYIGPPSAEFWGVGQTERWPSVYPNGDDGIYRAMRYATDAPNKAWNGGAVVFADIFLAVADISSDSDVASTDRAARQHYSLPPGRYDILKVSEVDFAPIAIAEVSFSMRKVTSGEDDIEIGKSIAYAVGETTGEDIHSKGNLILKDFEVDGTEQFYDVWTGLNEGNNTRLHTHIRKVD